MIVEYKQKRASGRNMPDVSFTVPN